MCVSCVLGKVTGREHVEGKVTGREHVNEESCSAEIEVPKSCDEGCYIRVGSENRRGWEEGKCLVFDDSFEHEAT